MFRLHVLGPASLVRGDGTEVPLLSSQPKLLALLAFLGATDHSRPPRRDTLLAIFWPEMDEAGARHALSQALSVIRRELGPEVMDGKWRDSVILSREGLWCDAVAFRHAVQDGRDEEALALYAGPLLDGFNMAGAPDFERWLDEERSELATMAVRTALRLTVRSEGEHDWLSARQWARRATRLDPYDEAAWRHLLKAMAANGERAAALAEFERFDDRLREDLGVAPSPETLQLLDDIRTRASVEQSAAAASLPVARHAAWNSTAEPSGLDPVAPSTLRPRWYGRRRLVVLLSVLLLGGFAGWVDRAKRDDIRDTLVAPAGMTRAPLLIAAFESDASDSLLAHAAMTAFRVDLTQSPRVRLLDQEQVEAALRRMGRAPDLPVTLQLAREIAVREGVSGVATGGILRAGGRYIVTGRIVSAKEGRDLFAVRHTARDSSELITVIDRVSKRVRRALGESADLLRAEPRLEHVTTASLDALRFYSDADRASTTDGALALLEQAIAHDSSFAMAYWKQATIYSAWGPESKRVAAVEKAWSLREHLPEPERSYAAAAYYRSIARDHEKGLAVWLSLLSRDPEDKEALFSVTDIYMRRHDFEHAWSYAQRAVAATHEFVAYYNAFVIAVARNDFAAAEAVLQQMGSRMPEHSFNSRLRGELAAARRDYAQADRYFATYRDGARVGTMDRAGANAMLAVTAEARGRIEDAKAHLRRDLQESAGLGPAFIVGRTLQLAAMMVRNSENQQAAQLVREVLAERPLASLPVADRPHFVLTTFYISIGDTARARRQLERAARELPLAKARLALAHGHADAAITAYRERLSARPAECMSCGLYELAWVYDMAGQTDSAQAIYERAIVTPGTRSVRAESEWLGPTLQRLAELHQARGDATTAARYYGQLVQLYRDGDASVQPRVERARQELARLHQAGAKPLNRSAR